MKKRTKKKKNAWFAPKNELLMSLFFITYVFSSVVFPKIQIPQKQSQEQKPKIEITYEEFVKTASLSADLIFSTPSPTPINPDSIGIKSGPTPLPKRSSHFPQVEAAEHTMPDYCVQVPVLLYHHIQPQALAIEKKQTSLSVDSLVFDEQMAYLVSSGYTVLSAKELVDALTNRLPLSSKSVVITLDDGYKDAYDYAYPIFQKYHVRGNLMIATGLVGGSDYLSWDQIKEMADSGLIYYANHTWSHFPLADGTPEKVTYEIETGRKQLEEHISQRVTIFTYPYGSFDSASIAILKQEGVLGAFSTIHGTFQCLSQIMILPRIHVGNAPLSAYGL